MAPIALPESLLERTIARPRPAWVTFGLILLLVALSLGASHVDDQLAGFLREGHWRMHLMAPATIGYILLVGPWVIGEERRAFALFRPVVMLDDDTLLQVVEREFAVQPWQELLAVGVGAALGLLPALLAGPGGVSLWLWGLQMAFTTLTMALLVWVIHGSIVSARWTSVLMRQPLKVDLFDMAPFEAIGRESLMLALVFVGGSALAVLFVGGQPDLAGSVSYLLIALPMVLVSVMVFFLSMRPTHRVLAQAKAQALADVRRIIPEAYRRVASQSPESEGGLAASSWLHTLLAYERRMEAAKTWPYNTEMLRALLLSVLIPIGTAFLRAAIG